MTFHSFSRYSMVIHGKGQQVRHTIAFCLAGTLTEHCSSPSVQTLTQQCFFTVSGDENFSMELTGLTVGGFTQTGVSCALIEVPTNTEKGLSQRFMWIFPNPLYEKFSSLGEVDMEFIKKILE